MSKRTNGISKEYCEVYEKIDEWVREVFGDEDQSLHDIVMAIDNIYRDEK